MTVVLSDFVKNEMLKSIPLGRVANWEKWLRPSYFSPRTVQVILLVKSST